MAHNFHPTSLREYDIRGIIGETLREADAYAIGRGFGTCLVRAGGKKAAVGYDGRESSPMLEEALVKGLNDSNVDVVRIGMGPTPMLYYAEAVLDDVDGGIEITGSHNPANYNGFKMVLMGKPFFGADIQKLGRMAAAEDWVDGTGTSEHLDILDQYVARVAQARSGWPISQSSPGSYRSGEPGRFAAACRRKETRFWSGL
jgi:phosphomannomutase